VLAVDQGTTGSRAVLYGADGSKVASAYREFPQHFPRPGWVEHDPLEIWRSVVDCVTEVLAGTPSVHVACVGITNQRETTVAWDARTGEPLHRAIVWQCRRTADRCAALNRDARRQEAIRRITGLPVDAYFSASKLEWLLANIPAVAATARAGTLRFGTIDSWLLWKMTNGAVHATDYTNAARTMLFDIDRLRWSGDLTAEFGVPLAALPEVRSSIGRFGVVAGGCGLPAGVPIAGVAGDQQAALFGQGCFAAGTAKNTYGTGAFVLLNAGACRPRGDRRLITTLGCGVDGNPVYVLEGAVFSAGAVIQWLRDELNLLDSASRSQQMAESVPDNAGVYFVPALVGLGAPYWDPDARGTIVGITRGTTRNHLVRAAVEAMCYRTRDVVDTMLEDTGLTLKELKVDGGAAANDFMCQFQADMLGVNVVRPVDVESTARGAAALAGLGSGFWKDAGQLDASRAVDRVFSPAMSPECSSRLYAEWQGAVRRALSGRNEDGCHA
jgi:glycerol kinase